MTKEKNIRKTNSNYSVFDEKKGVVVSLYDSHGFIEYKTGIQTNRIFFHKNDLINKDIKLLSAVRFFYAINQEGKHRGKSKAVRIRSYYTLAEDKPLAASNQKHATTDNEITSDHIALLKSKFKVTTNQPKRKSEHTYIGQIFKFDTTNQTGFIRCNELKLDARFTAKHVNNLNLNLNLKLNDYVIFTPGDTNKSKDYINIKEIYNKIEEEKDLDFLLKEYSKTPIKKIRSQINKLIHGKPIENVCSEVSPERLFYFQFSHLNLITPDENYNSLVNIIFTYKKVNWSPTLSTLSEKCDEECLIKLFENGVIDKYNFTDINKYFHIAESKSKLKIIKRLNESERHKILSEHINILRQDNKLSSLNEDLKTLLIIIRRNEKTRDLKLFNIIESELKLNLAPKELIELWLDKYIGRVDKIVIDKYLKEDGASFIQDVIDKAVPSTLNKYNPLIKRHQQLKKESTKIKDEATSIQSKEISIPPKEASDEPQQSHSNDFEDLDVYHKVKYLLSYSQIIFGNIDTLIFSVTKDKLQSYIQTNPWDSKIIPIASIDKIHSHSSFIHDIEKFNEILNQNISVNSLATTIFNSIESHTVHHIRLWLQGYVDNSFFNYSGFSEAYGQLTEEEKRFFNKKVNKTTRSKLRIQQKSNVIPCTIFEKLEDGTFLYTAHLDNIYFSTQQFQLCIADNKFTNPLYHKNAGSHLNGMSNNESLNKIDIKITVEDNNITKVENLDQIISKIHLVCKTKDLIIQEKAERSGNAPIYYPVDWNLVAQFNNYFYSKQCDEFDIIFIDENDTDAESTYDEKTALYTLKCDDDDYAIIWNNVDLIESRSIYVFKAKHEHVELQLNKLLKFIGTYRQFRQILLQSIQDELHQSFKDNFGYIGTIKKAKGKTNAFEETLQRLENLMSAPTLPIPSEEIQEKLEDWMLMTKSIPETTNSYEQNSTIHRERKTAIPKLETDRDFNKDIKHISNQKSSSEQRPTSEYSNKTTYTKDLQPREIKNTPTKSPKHLESIINLVEDVSRAKQEKPLNKTAEEIDNITNIEPENSVPTDKETIEKVAIKTQEEVNDNTRNEQTDEEAKKYEEQIKLRPIKGIVITIVIMAIIGTLAIFLLKLTKYL